MELTRIPKGPNSIAMVFVIQMTAAFVIPMILGKGRVLFISNLIYTRFSEIADYPSGAAISIVLFVVALTIGYVLSRQINKRWRS